jgi:hypothetical protein
MKRHTCRVSLVLTGLIVLGVAAYDLAASQRFSEWSAPVNLGPTINSSSNDYSPAISRNGRVLYFGSDRPGGFGGIDIWVARRASVRPPLGYADEPQTPHQYECQRRNSSYTMGVSA